MSNKTNYDFPIFNIFGDDFFEEEANNVVELNNAILDVSNVIDNANKELENCGNRLNLYVNNTLKLQEAFDYDEHILVFNEDEDVCIYPGKYVDDFIEQTKNEEEDVILNDEELEDLLKSLPPTENKFKLNKKQKNHLIDLMSDFNSAFGQYEYYIYEYNDLTDEYNQIISHIKRELLGITFMDITNVIDKKFEFEKFNEDKHELLVTKDSETFKWKFIYIRKEDKEKFVNLLHKD